MVNFVMNQPNKNSNLYVDFNLPQKRKNWKTRGGTNKTNLEKKKIYTLTP